MSEKNEYVEKVHGISEKKIGQAIDRATKANKTGGKQLKEYLNAMRARCKPKTLENYTNSLSRIIVLTKKAPRSLNNSILRRHFEKIKDMSQGTRYAHYQALRSYFCDYLKYDKMIDKKLLSKWEKLMDNIKRPTTSGKRNITRNDHLKPAEVDQLLHACRNPRDKALIMCLLESGARISEVLSLQVKDINFEAEPVEIKIKHSKTEEREGKRSVYLFRGAPLLRAWLDVHPLNNDGSKFLKSNALVFVNINTEPTPLSPNTAHRILKLIRERAGLANRKLYAHLFRHTRATDLKDVYGFDVREIQEWLGHTKMETTSGYLTADKKRMLQKLSGETDKFFEEQRQFAIAHNQPVPCPCGRSNDPESTFCPRCGRVVDRQAIEEQANDLTDVKHELAEMKEEMALARQMREEIFGKLLKEGKKVSSRG